jgi:hypothetical protein
VPNGELMGPREVLYVVQQQLRQLETADPFTDDYYYIMVGVGGMGRLVWWVRGRGTGGCARCVRD